MTRYQVPQFIEVEDKIFGPLTLKQFLYVFGGSALFFLSWSFLPNFIALIVGTPLLIFFIALAFYKVNNRPFSFLIESAIKYYFSSKLYIWKKETKKPVKKEVNNQPQKITVPKLSDSKLKDLTWGLDIQENINNIKQN